MSDDDLWTPPPMPLDPAGARCTKCNTPMFKTDAEALDAWDAVGEQMHLPPDARDIPRFECPSCGLVQQVY